MKKKTIKKIKENERKYTTILVIIFMILLVIISYFTFKIDNHKISKKEVVQSNILESTSRILTLTNDYIMSDKDGLKTKPIVITITNNTSRNTNYKIKLIKDDNISKICNCMERTLPTEYIRYSIDNKNVDTIKQNSSNELLITTGSLKYGESKTINIKVWVDKSTPKDNDYHFHGYFRVEHLSDLN